jgi:hypothetical protein
MRCYAPTASTACLRGASARIHADEESCRAHAGASSSIAQVCEKASFASRDALLGRAVRSLATARASMATTSLTVASPSRGEQGRAQGGPVPSRQPPRGVCGERGESGESDSGERGCAPGRAPVCTAPGIGNPGPKIVPEVETVEEEAYGEWRGLASSCGRGRGRASGGDAKTEEATPCWAHERHNRN